MTDVMTAASSGIAVRNGVVIVSAQKTGTYSRKDPDVNNYIPSGTFITRLENRFDEYYGGPPSGV